MKKNRRLPPEVVADVTWRIGQLRRILADHFRVFDIDRTHCLGLPSGNLMAVSNWNKADAVWIHPSADGRYLVLRGFGSSLSIDKLLRSLSPELRSVLRVRAWRKRPMRQGEPDQNWGQFLSPACLAEARRLGLPV